MAKIYVCKTCHKQLPKNVQNKMQIDPISTELKDLKRLENMLTSKKILFKKLQ